MKNALLLIFALALSACSDNLGPSQMVKKPTQNGEVKRMLFGDRETDSSKITDPLAHSKAVWRGEELGVALHEGYKNGVSLVETCKRADKLLTENAEGTYAYQTQQAIALSMVNLLVDKNLDEQTSASLKQYTKILIDSNNPDLPLLRKSFLKLKGHWDIAEAALYEKKAIQIAEAWVGREAKSRLKKKEGCENCPKQVQEGNQMEDAATEKSVSSVKEALSLMTKS
ncbi:MAG: hypothetical protein J0L94_03920 [Rhodothermia bacterium]|nr:hypothetical protein [Rhodothermia bacterium]